MRKTYRFFLALVLFALNAVVANAGKADLDPAMFKAWDSNLPGANVVAEPDPEPKSGNPFACTYALYEEVGAYGTIYGSPNSNERTYRSAPDAAGAAGERFPLDARRPGRGSDGRCRRPPGGVPQEKVNMNMILPGKRSFIPFPAAFISAFSPPRPGSSAPPPGPGSPGGRPSPGRSRNSDPGS